MDLDIVIPVIGWKSDSTFVSEAPRFPKRSHASPVYGCGNSNMLMNMRM